MKGRPYSTSLMLLTSANIIINIEYTMRKISMIIGLSIMLMKKMMNLITKVHMIQIIILIKTIWKIKLVNNRGMLSIVASCLRISNLMRKRKL